MTLARRLGDTVRINPNNRETRQPLVLLVDTSGSMQYNMHAVREGIAALKNAIGRLRALRLEIGAK